MIKLIPYDFLEDMEVDQWKDLPQSFKDLMKDSVAKAKSQIMKSIHLHKHSSNGNIYQVKLKSTHSKGSRSHDKLVYCNYDEVTEDLSHEPYLMDHIVSVANVGSFRHLHFGYGSKNNEIVEPEGRITRSQTNANNPKDPSPSVWDNWWYSRKNEHHLCAEGSCANLCMNLGLIPMANFIKHISLINNVETIIREMGQVKIPHSMKNPQGSRNGQFHDPILKCLWPLQVKYHIGRQPLDTLRSFRTPTSTLNDLECITLPTILSLKSTSYGEDGILCNHVVAFWCGQIIDFEHDKSYPLTIDNLNFACGYGRKFECVTKGFSLHIPSQTWRKYCGRYVYPLLGASARLYSSYSSKNKKRKARSRNKLIKKQMVENETDDKKNTGKKPRN